MEAYFFLGFIFLVLLYFVPAVIAFVRCHRNANSIFVINLFLGWTLLGWVIALAWSVSSNVHQDQSQGSKKEPHPFWTSNNPKT